MCECVALSLSLCLSLSMSLSYGCFIFLRFDGSETLIKINISRVSLRPTNVLCLLLLFFSLGLGFPIHPLGCLELEAFVFPHVT